MLSTAVQHQLFQGLLVGPVLSDQLTSAPEGRDGRTPGLHAALHADKDQIRSCDDLHRDNDTWSLWHAYGFRS